MNTKSIITFFLLLITIILLVGCSTLANQPPIPDTGEEPVFTSAAQTVIAQVTLSAGETAVAQLTQMASMPTATQTPEPTPTDALLPTATVTMQPTATQTPPPPTPIPPTPIPCDRGQFVQDVTVADGSVYAPGANFTKIWRLKNAGSCTWDTNYALVFVSGDALGSRTLIPMPYNVRPGETVDLAVELTAPGWEGRYRGDWFLRNQYGQIFGVGADGTTPVWVSIRVTAPPNRGYAYDFAAYFCSATWTSSAGRLPCPGSSSSENGSVVLLDRPTLESGATEDELTLWTRPQVTNGGWITGLFPGYKVKPGDHFLADIGCLADSSGCDVTFSLDYLLSNGWVRNLGTWGEVYDGNHTRIDIDLSPLAGETVQFMLSVTANSRPSQANAFWLVPSIRPGSPPPPTNNPAALAAQQRIAQDLGLEASTVGIRSIEAAEWSDSCLGVHLPDQVCAPAVVPGYRIILYTISRRFEAHTNQDGSIVFWFETQ